MNLRRGKRGPWLGCSTFPKCKGRSSWSKIDEAKRGELQARLEQHEETSPHFEIRTLDGRIIPPGTPVSELAIAGGVAELQIHPEAELPRAKSA